MRKSVGMGPTLRVVGLGLAVLSAAGCVSRSQYDKLYAEYHAENQARLRVESELSRKQNEMSAMRGQLETAQSRAVEVGRMSEERIQQLEQALRDAEARFAFAGDGMEVYQTDEGFMILLQDELLFDSGSIEIREKGKSALNAIAKEIVSKGYPEVRIDGHTDSDPVKRTAEIFPRGNIELAAERALSVYEYLSKSGQVKSDVLTIAAFGPNRPLATGNSGEAKARNRRVEIHVRVPN